MPRIKLTAEGLAYTMDRIKQKLEKRLVEKGPLSLTSSHEILGIIDEEVDEFKLEVKNNNHELMEEELLDVAVGCIIGIMSKYDKGLDW